MKNPFAALEACFLRRTARLAHPGAARIAVWLVPLLFGLLSLALGQDDNWDMKNYHWYNPYALLHGRLDLDMAPGQWQSYFNPLIDVPYYVLNALLPAPVVGFLMGCVHGLNFVLLLAIARHVLGARAGDRLPLLLALIGTLGAGFLSELGNTMGDNLTALLVLAALYLVLRAWDRLHTWSGRTAAIVLLSGLLMGLGAGLKLTNATYATALCIALLTAPASLRMRIALAFMQGCAVVAGMLLSAGYWWMTMWEHFGNPLFPQFNNIFRSPLAQQFGVIDNFHMPRNALEALFWPFVFMADNLRVSEIPLKMAVLPALYALALVFIVCWLAERFKGSAPHARLAPRARFLLVFGLVAYLVWAKLFGIYRYLVPLELLAPMMVWVLVERIATPRIAPRAAGWLLALTTLAVFPFGTWGHAGWAASSFSAQVPPLAQPASTIVFTAHAHPPMGWLATFFPREVRVIALAGGFPESPAYLERIQAAIAGGQGPHYVLLAAARNEKENGLARKLALADTLGFTKDARGCERLDGLLQRVRFQVQVKHAAQAGRQCTLELQPRYRVDLAAEDRKIMETAQKSLAYYGLTIDAGGCMTYPAAVGSAPYPFRFCPVTAGRSLNAPASGTSPD
jgi:hypothetical protein